MLSDGLYGVDYHAAIDKPDVIGSGLAVFRAGKILATDRCGSVFIGSYTYDSASSRSRVAMRLQLPPGELVTGQKVSDSGAHLDVEGELVATDRIETTIDVGGRPVKIKLTYLGPPPD